MAEQSSLANETGHQIEIDKMVFGWKRAEGILTAMGLPSALFWLDPSLLQMLRPLAEELGYDMFRLKVAWSSSQGTKEDYEAMVTAFSDNFADGFLAWGKAVGAAGWGVFELPAFDIDAKTATVVVRSTWELLMQQRLEERWGCPFIQGKVIGIFSHAFGCNCWADEVETSYEEGQLYVKLKVYPSERTIDNELSLLRIKRMEQKERELTELVHLQTEKLESSLEEIQKAREVAEEASQAKSLFLAGMSHELRTPLNAILGYAELLQDELNDVSIEEALRDLAKIQKAGRHLLGLINQVLDLSKIEAGQVKVTTDVFGLGGFLEEIARLSESLARDKDNSFSMTWGGVPELIDTDALKIKQILLNLIGNACKFTDNGKVSLEVDWQEEPSLLLFHVQDTGIGIPEHKRELIFEEFAQESTDTHRMYGGTGLGLSLSSRLAGLLGGRILLESEVNVGSTFTLVLPVVPVSTA